MKFISLVGALFLSLSLQVLADEQTEPTIEAALEVLNEELSAEEMERIQWASNLWESMNQQTGTIDLKRAGATLTIPDSFYYLNPQDAEKVLVEVWGNLAGQNTLGMIFPKGSTPFDRNAWAVTIEYEEDGYVTDEDADDINYDELLTQMKKDSSEASKYRVEQGYEPIKLIGWAAKPYYDANANKMHWAKEIQFGNSEVNTLNYNIRILGRKGVLILNFIASMEQLDEINTNIETVLSLADFDQGSKYSDFNPDIDEVAAYGLGALVAGKLIAKTGFLAIAFVFLKKFGVIIIIAVGAFLKRVLFRKKPY